MTILVEEGLSVETLRVEGQEAGLARQGNLSRVLAVVVLARAVLLSADAGAFLCKNAAGFSPQLGCVPTAIGAALPTGLQLPQLAQCECDWHNKINAAWVTLNQTPVAPGVYGDASHVPQITVDAAGRITNATPVGIAAGGGPGFNLISSGTNTTAGMLCSTGCSVSPINSGVVSANQWIGAPISDAVPTDRAIMIADGTQWTKRFFTGDVTNTNTGVTSVITIRGGAVSNAWATPTAGLMIVGSGAAWIPRAISGDISSVSNTGVMSLASIISPATVGDATHIPQITFDSKGRLTTVTSILASGGGGCAPNSSCTLTGTGSFDGRAGLSVRPVVQGTSVPGTCTQGDFFQKTTDGSVSVCTATNTFSKVCFESGTIGTPTCGANCASVAGNDKTFDVTTNAGVTSITVNFSTTLGTVPICVASTNSTSVTTGITTVSTTLVTFGTSGAITGHIYAHCTQTS